MTVDIITTVNGGRDTAVAGLKGGALIGYESANERPPEEIDIEFVDWPFMKVEESSVEEVFEEHLEVVKRERPRYAVAPDIDGTTSLYSVLQMAEQLAEYA